MSPIHKTHTAAIAVAMILTIVLLDHRLVEAQDQTTAAQIFAYIGDMCLTNAQCIVLNSVCTESGDNSGTMRCRCKANYYPYDPTRPSKGLKTDIQCGMLAPSSASSCVTCLNNEGTCVYLSGQTIATFCQCPISRTGSNCEDIHVNVTCNMQDMTVCYSPHPQVNFSDGWMMYASDHTRNSLCVGYQVTAAGGVCPLNTQELQLSLNTTELDTCGTANIENSQNIRYTNTIEVAQFDFAGRPVPTVTPIVFSVYCSFRAFQDQTFNGIGVGSVNGNDRGTQVNPNITIMVTDQFGRQIEKGVTLIVGDNVKFIFSMTKDVNYEGLQVMRVTASTSPVMPDSTAETRALMTRGCPVTGESTGSSWYWTNSVLGNQLNVTSRPVPIFKMSSSIDVYFHCALKLCMTGDHSCAALTQAQCAAMQTRRKRDTASDLELSSVVLSRKRRETSNVDVSTNLKVADPNAQSVNEGNNNNNNLAVGSSGYIALLVIMAIIAAVLIVVVVVIAVRVNRRKSVSDSGSARPQLFALPRINRTHERF